ncbi:protease FtsH subunit HflC [Allofrancisella inopinata]|uniref:Protein HflC n=1 Tax=Allofrancisella inopinata TaxID=1085647 RepID=A0AAE6YJF6_9GAMM|nr:protease modulator HflC [Allofrancisella inopinata]QIV95862.1 protease modulator HflC [Allofrancisella inopinata]TDT72902.1 protease FtsH subunit HflC [Allofrancisella inopinata]
MKNLSKILLVLVVVGLFLILSSKFIVKQGTESVLLRLGELVKKDDKVIEYKPGIHIKIPFLDTVKNYDMRNRVLTTDSSRVVTKEKKDVLINAYVVWRINDISRFFTSTSGQVFRAETLLKQFLESSLRAEVGKNDIQSLVNNDRDKLMIALTKDVAVQAKEIGISIVDVRVNQIDLPETITESIYQRMKSSRHKDASRIRAEGERAAEKTKASADATVTVTMAEAEKQSKIIRAEADAKAAKIFADAYSSSIPLYEFLKSMNSYKESFSGKNEVVFMLKPDSKFFQGFKLKPDSKLAEDMKKAK